MEYLKRYTDFINEAKKGLQMSHFPEIVPHEPPDPEAPTDPTASAIDQDLLREYLLEMTDQGWEITMESFLTRRKLTKDERDFHHQEYYEMSDVLLPGENNVVLEITFTNSEDSEQSPSEILYTLDNLADEAGYKTYYAPEDCPDEMKERDEIFASAMASKYSNITGRRDTQLAEIDKKIVEIDDKKRSFLKIR